jgi:hypothetical protein
VVHEGIARSGKIDILLTNSGGPPAGPFESLEDNLRLSNSLLPLPRPLAPGETLVLELIRR